MIRYLLVILALAVSLPEPSSAARKQDKARREVLRWLDRSLAAQRNIGTADVRCSVWISRIGNPAVVLYSAGMDAVCRTVPADTVCGFWFSVQLTDFGTGNKSRIVYNGNDLFHAPGDSVMTVLPVEKVSKAPLFSMNGTNG